MTFDPATLVVLVVDPREDARARLRGLAERVGIASIRLAAGVAEAFERLRDGRVGVVVLDGDAGEAPIAFLRALRWKTRGRLQETPVILVAAADAGTLKAARDAGVTELMAHPPTAKVLRERLEEAVVRPRRFIRSATYVGPCRRRRRLQTQDREERRAAARPVVGGESGPAR